VREKGCKKDTFRLERGNDEGLLVHRPLKGGGRHLKAREEKVSYLPGKEKRGKGAEGRCISAGGKASHDKWGGS